MDASQAASTTTASNTRASIQSICLNRNGRTSGKASPADSRASHGGITKNRLTPPSIAATPTSSSLATSVLPYGLPSRLSNLYTARQAAYRPVTKIPVSANVAELDNEAT